MAIPAIDEQHEPQTVKVDVHPLDETSHYQAINLGFAGTLSILHKLGVTGRKASFGFIDIVHAGIEEATDYFQRHHAEELSGHLLHARNILFRGHEPNIEALSEQAHHIHTLALPGMEQAILQRVFLQIIAQSKPYSVEGNGFHRRYTYANPWLHRSDYVRLAKASHCGHASLEQTYILLEASFGGERRVYIYEVRPNGTWCRHDHPSAELESYVALLISHDHIIQAEHDRPIRRHGQDTVIHMGHV